MMRVRKGASIREFLGYYVLVLLSRKGRTRRELVDAIQHESDENRAVRAGGVLRVASFEMEHSLRSLAGTGFIRWVGGKRVWNITAAGQRKRREYESEGWDKLDSKEAAAERLLSLVESGSSPARILDVGTGEGFLALKLAHRGFRVLGIDRGCFDYSKDSIQKAKEQGIPLRDRVEFRKADVAKLRGLDETFDYVVASQAIHCMRNPLRCLRAIYRLLKPGGKFISSDFAVGVRAFLAHGFHCFLAVSQEEWEELLPRLGFAEVRIHDSGDFIVVEARKPTAQMQ
jgi:SAM-dependent methyltransferase